MEDEEEDEDFKDEEVDDDIEEEAADDSEEEAEEEVACWPSLSCLTSSVTSVLNPPLVPLYLHRMPPLAIYVCSGLFCQLCPCMLKRLHHFVTPWGSFSQRRRTQRECLH